MRKIALSLLLLAAFMQAGPSNINDLIRDETIDRTRGLWDKDAAALNDIISFWSRRLGPDALCLAQYYSRLGTALMKAGDPSGAEQALRSALPILNANGPEYMAAADLVNHQLVSALRAQNKTQEADNLKASLPPSPPDQPTDTKPQIMSKVEAQYSEAARRKGLSGSITLRALIEETGNPKEIQVIQPLGFGLDENAVKAVQQWRFKPPTRNGVPTTCHVTVEVNFRYL